MATKALYVTSCQRSAGKTAVCLALGRRLQQEGRSVGYFKPISIDPWRMAASGVYDEDAEFVRRTLGLAEPVKELVGVVLTPSLIDEMRCGSVDRNLVAEVKAAYTRVAADKDFVLLEGGTSLWEGLSLNVHPLKVAEELDVPILSIIRFVDRINVADTCVATQAEFGDRLAGEFVNAVPEDCLSALEEICRPSWEDRGIAILGAMPLRPRLEAISVRELVDVLDGEFLALPEKMDMLIEHFVVGAMSVHQALPRMRRIAGAKAVITGGDRADIQLAAVETAAKCLILTGYLRPAPEILYRAEDAGIPVISVHHNTLETVEAIQEVFGKTRLGLKAKLEEFETLFSNHFDYSRLYQRLGL